MEIVHVADGVLQRLPVGTTDTVPDVFPVRCTVKVNDCAAAGDGDARPRNAAMAMVPGRVRASPA
jgi:hypothetical protein